MTAKDFKSLYDHDREFVLEDRDQWGAVLFAEFCGYYQNLFIYL